MHCRASLGRNAGEIYGILRSLSNRDKTHAPTNAPYAPTNAPNMVCADNDAAIAQRLEQIDGATNCAGAEARGYCVSDKFPVSYVKELCPVTCKVCGSNSSAPSGSSEAVMRLKMDGDLTQDIIIQTGTTVFFDGQGHTIKTGKHQIWVQDGAKLCMYNIRLVDGTVSICLLTPQIPCFLLCGLCGAAEKRSLHCQNKLCSI